MRKVLCLTVIAVLASGASGCACRHWRPGQLLFGRGTHATTVCVPAAPACCDPCGGMGGGVISSGAMIEGETCCQ